jgi:uncharacterized protein YbjT (DUF2867 family)
VPDATTLTIVIAGAHGQIARLLGELLSGDGHTVRGIIRNPDHAADLQAIGVTPVLHDLEGGGPGLTDAVRGADAVVFAAGAGPGSGPERKASMDRDGAIRLIEACRQTGVRRYVIVSAMGARPGAQRSGSMAAYLEAKGAADAALADSGLDYTIVRPGALSDDPPTERVTVAPELPRGSIPRADVARVLLAVLATPSTIGQAFDLVGGTTPIRAALAEL